MMQIFGTKSHHFSGSNSLGCVLSSSKQQHRKSCCALLLGILGKGAMIAIIVAAIAVVTTKILFEVASNLNLNF